jgi:hypothetical protein
MEPLSTNHAIWLARGEALGIILQLLQDGLRASMIQLRQIGLGRSRLLKG